MKFTSEVRRRLVAAVAAGCFRFQACALAGITRQTLYRWEQLAEREPDGEHAEFVGQLQLAQDQAECRLMLLHFGFATGAPLPPDLVETLKGPLGKFHQDALLPALQYRLTYGGSRPWADIRRAEHSGQGGCPIEVTGTRAPRDAAAQMRDGFRAEARLRSVDGGKP